MSGVRIDLFVESEHGPSEGVEKSVPQGLKPYFLWRLDHTAEAVCLRGLLRRPLGVVVWGVLAGCAGLKRVLEKSDVAREDTLNG